MTTIKLSLLTLALSISVAAQDPKAVNAKPDKGGSAAPTTTAITPLSTEEERSLFRAALNLMSLRNKTLEDLGEDKLGKAQQKAEKTAQDMLLSAHAAFRKAHNAPEYCEWNLFQGAWQMAAPNGAAVECSAEKPLQSGTEPDKGASK